MFVRKICIPCLLLLVGLFGYVVPKSTPGNRVTGGSEVTLTAFKSFGAQKDPQDSRDSTPQSQPRQLQDYHNATWDPIHRQPAILTAENQDCLKCHSEILSRKVLPKSPAGVEVKETLAWYQTLDTYEGDQQTFHWRHLESPYAKQVMDLKCNFCHQGNDPREEAPFANGDPAGFTLRKMVDPETTCLKCHATMNWKVMTLPAPLAGPWPQVRDMHQNDCLSCHAIYRTVRHQVSYLHADKIEELAKTQNMGGDVCYGCHGGRAWYRVGYPYPRHPYPGMDKIPEPYPEWAKDRPQESEPRYALPITTPDVDAGASAGSTPSPAVTSANAGLSDPATIPAAESANTTVEGVSSDLPNSEESNSPSNPSGPDARAGDASNNITEKSGSATDNLKKQ